MKITIFRRYDSNGSFTHDFEFKFGAVAPESNSMLRFDGVFEATQLDIHPCHGCGELVDYTEEDHVFCPHCLESL